MAVPSVSQFLARFPELSQTPLAVVKGALETAGRQNGESVWGSSHTDGCAFYAAHLLALRVRQIGATVGQSVSGPSGTSFESTFYGQQYMDLLRSLPLTGFAV